VVEGILNGLDSKKVTVEVDKKVVAVDTGQVAAVALSTELADALRPRGTYGRVVLAGTGRARGSRLSLSAATCDGRTLKGTTVFGAALDVPLAQVAALDLYQGRAVYLSDLKPTRFVYTPFLGEPGVRWGLVTDGNVAGHDLRLGGSTYDKGIGLHSRSRVTYDLAGAYQRFEAVVGLDDRLGRRGNVRVRVLADGKAFDPVKGHELTARTGPVTVRVPLAGVKELTLEVDFGRGGDVQGVVNWADARLIK
jgi:hypothetical protein